MGLPGYFTAALTVLVASGRTVDAQPAGTLAEQGNETAGGPSVSSGRGAWAIPLPPATNVSLFPPPETEVNSTYSTEMNTEGMQTMTDIVTSTLKSMQETTGVPMEQNTTATPTDVAATEDTRTPSDASGRPSATTQEVATESAFTTSDATGTRAETTGTTAHLTQTPPEREATSTEAGETAGTHAAANDTTAMQETTKSRFPTMLTPTTMQESTTITTGAITTGRTETPAANMTESTARTTIPPQSTTSAQTTVRAQPNGTETTAWATTLVPTISLQTTASGQTTVRPETVLPNVTGTTAGATREQTTQTSPVTSSSPPTSPSRPVLFSHLPYMSKPMVLPQGLDEFMGRIGIPKTSARPFNLPTLARPVSAVPLRLG